MVRLNILNVTSIIFVTQNSNHSTCTVENTYYIILFPWFKQIKHSHKRGNIN